MPAWKGIVGRGFSRNDFAEYLGSLKFESWRPQFVTVHNTARPRLSEWASTPGEQRMRNLEHYYRDEKGWTAGPHLFVASDLIWVFTALTTSGVHSPSWNGVAWGVEIVGDYEVEAFSGDVQDNAVAALAALHAVRGLAPSTLRFHKEDIKTSHKNCPGKNIHKGDLIRRIEKMLEGEGEHLTDRP